MSNKKNVKLSVASVPDFADKLAGLLQTGVVITESWPMTTEEIRKEGNFEITLTVEERAGSGVRES